ncbi:hypothetical protein SAMN05192532_103406 [Alteribacillus iranensis]|uniref:Uncharacterized protein n=2 Tax=Alteribacillus iranensis TaxID=930128 RepID=A0A1I2D4L0_9BACI|nr:hypothetical protein SAMN05192532_103406 [Alteribacillus iranensis]
MNVRAHRPNPFLKQLFLSPLLSLSVFPLSSLYLQCFPAMALQVLLLYYEVINSRLEYERGSVTYYEKVQEVILMASFFRIVNAIVLWAIVFRFLPKRSFQKYAPVTLFCTCIFLIQSLLNFIFNWWDVKGGLKYKVFDDLAFIFGPFFTINLWVFHFTYGKFSLYAVSNLIMDLIYAYLLNPLFQKIGHYKLKGYNSTVLFLKTYTLAMLNYGFQMFRDNTKF